MKENKRIMQNNIKNHHFTVVIPTRERCDTLEHALHTCVIQDYDNLEILVSDNFSQDQTREVIKSYKDPRIRYINTGKRLCMADNYEFALSHVKPEGYVIYIGDDDGLLPNAIHDINVVIAETGARVLRWELAHYWWPNLESNCDNQLYIFSLGLGTTRRDSATTIQNVLSFQAPYQSLPMLYMCSAVDYEVIRSIKNLSGRFYHSGAADVYSGFAIAGSVDSFVNSKRSFTIGGSSRHSIGASQISFAFTAPFLKCLNDDKLPFHSSLVFCSSAYQTIIESFLQARDHLPYFQRFTVDMEKMLFLMMEESTPKALDNYMTVKDAVLQIGQMHNIPEAAQRAIAANPKREPGSGRKFTVRNLISAAFHVTRLFIADLRNGSFYLDCSSLNVKNIYDASLLCDHILRLKDINILGCSTVFKSSLANIKRIIVPEKQRRSQKR